MGGRFVGIAFLLKNIAANGIARIKLKPIKTQVNVVQAELVLIDYA